MDEQNGIRRRLTFSTLYVLGHSFQSQLIQHFVWWAEAQGAGEEVTQEVHWQEHRGGREDNTLNKQKSSDTQLMYWRTTFRCLYFWVFPSIC